MFAAVFEDDVHLAADIARLFSSVDWIPGDADIVRLENEQQDGSVQRQAIVPDTRASNLPRRIGYLGNCWLHHQKGDS